MVWFENNGAIAIGAAAAMAAGAIGTAWAQASIGSSIMGVVAERPEDAMKLIIYMALPELIVLLGFVVAFLLIGKVEAGATAAAGHA
ncbi:MAG: ATPase [Candidatus Micrarchaeota archaeon]|nr:ATPase [Candidatus Micrarchaeota archaeon]